MKEQVSVRWPGHDLVPTLQEPITEVQQVDDTQVDPNKHFITANSQPISMESLMNDCIVPVFAKDNQVAISHQEFVGAVYEAAQQFYSGEQINTPQLRVSHIVRGRVPSAIGKPVSQLLPEDKTMYYQRMAFAIDIPTITENINGCQHNLSIVGVKSYTKDNLSGKLTNMNFSCALSMMNRVCCNMSIFSGSDGIREDFKALTPTDIYRVALELFQNYNMARDIYTLKALNDVAIDETTFCQILGRCRLYQFLPLSQKKHIPQLLIGDSQINNVAKQFYRDNNFKADDNGEISMFKFYNLMTGAVKNSYIDTFLPKNANAGEVCAGIASALKGESDEYKWFLG